MMKKYLAMAAAVAFSAMTVSAFAAPQQLMRDDTGTLRPAGTVSAHGALSLDDLQDELAEKAREQGAKGFVIDAAGGENQMYGTATIYK